MDASTAPDGNVPPREDGGVDADADAAPPGSQIAISVVDLGSAAQTIDLTDEGTLDWVYWAYDGDLSEDVRKAGVTVPLIATPYGLRGTSVFRGTSSLSWPIKQTWTDGTDPQTGQSSYFTYLNNSSDASITMNAVAATTTRTFTFIAGANQVDAVVEARLLDGTEQQEPVNATGTARYVRVAISYQSAIPDRWLEINWRITKRHQSTVDAAISVTSASLR